jgi:hypothetical protein
LRVPLVPGRAEALVVRFDELARVVRFAARPPRLLRLLDVDAEPSRDLLLVAMNPSMDWVHVAVTRSRRAVHLLCV